MDYTSDMDIEVTNRYDLNVVDAQAKQARQRVCLGVVRSGR